MEPGHGGQECEKVPLKVVERRLQDFTHTTLPLDLARLRTHRDNILQLQGSGSWRRLHSEQINATRTVQVCAQPSSVSHSIHINPKVLIWHHQLTVICPVRERVGWYYHDWSHCHFVNHQDVCSSVASDTLLHV